MKKCGVKVKNHIYDDLYEQRQKNLLSKGAKGLECPRRLMFVAKGWLKQLKVAISTWASVPNERKSTKFVKQILSTYTRREPLFFRHPRDFACKTARWGG
jgi:hypothetical protein